MEPTTISSEFNADQAFPLARSATPPSYSDKENVNPFNDITHDVKLASHQYDEKKTADLKVSLPLKLKEKGKSSAIARAMAKFGPTLDAAKIEDPETLALLAKALDNDEPLLKENPNRFVLFPIEHMEIWEMYKKHVASFWTAEEIDLGDDKKDWARMQPQERHFITTVLAFFAASDGIVLENLTKNFINEVQSPEARCFYAFQAAMENIHSETYSLLIDTYISDSKEKAHVLRAIETIDCVRIKAEWALKWMNETCPFIQRLVAYACIEGIFFSGSFCAIFWLKKKGLMPGLTFSNELISRDEGLHTDFACLLYRLCKHKLSQKVIHLLIRDAVACEKKFVCEALSVRLIGMNAESMSQYIEFVADRLCHALGVEKIWKTKNPFEWMEIISLQGKTNFFEKRVGEYAKAGVMASLDEDGDGFSLDCEF